MKHLKMLGLAAVAVMTMTALTVASASATTLEVGGVTQNKSVTFSMSLQTGTSSVTSRTDGSLANTCTASSVGFSTVSPYTGATVTAPISTLSYTGCERPLTVHKAGTLHFAHTGATNGTVSSSGTELTMGSPFGTLNCKTGAGVHIGTVTGRAAGQAELHINAVLNCGFLVPSASWKGTYAVTSPAGLGVSA